MKRGAYFINVGRGRLVDEADLMAALDSGHLSGAVLDVFRTEPLPPESPLWSHPKVVVTPHESGGTPQGSLAHIAENYRRLLAGQPLINIADPAARILSAARHAVSGCCRGSGSGSCCGCRDRAGQRRRSNRGGARAAACCPRARRGRDRPSRWGACPLA